MPIPPGWGPKASDQRDLALGVGIAHRRKIHSDSGVSAHVATHHGLGLAAAQMKVEER